MDITVEYLSISRFSACGSRMMFYRRNMTHLLLFGVLAVYLAGAGLAGGMQITSTGPQTIQAAKGEKVIMSCTYTPGASDTGELDIEWSNLSPDMTQKDQLILSYTGGRKYLYGDQSLMTRMDFTAGDPTQGDASVHISNIQPSDTATYQCKVKKSPGVDTRKMTLSVLAPPSVPKCWVQGPEEIGSPVSLRCEAASGSAPITYTWSRGGEALPSISTQNPTTGELLIKNHTAAFAGTYVCLAKNAVGQQLCSYKLGAYQPNRVGVIVGAVIGALLLLLLLLLLIWLLICCCCKRRYEKEVANEIREDAAAPESRPASRNTSYRSVLGYRSHSGLNYTSVPNLHPPISERASSYAESTKPVQNPALSAPALPYDSRYGYPV